jgi:hypothetical protein
VCVSLIIVNPPAIEKISVKTIIFFSDVYLIYLTVSVMVIVFPSESRDRENDDFNSGDGFCFLISAIPKMQVNPICVEVFFSLRFRRLRFLSLGNSSNP